MPNHLSTTSFTALVLAAVFVAGCEGDAGPQGPQGPEGPATPYDRAATYCLQGAGISATSGWSVSITCAQVADIPVAGSCYAADLPPGGFIASSRATDWADTTRAARWSCTWGWQPGTEPTAVAFSFGGTAEICCATAQ
jgi:hypothetical protein